MTFRSDMDVINYIKYNEKFLSTLGNDREDFLKCVTRMENALEYIYFAYMRDALMFAGLLKNPLTEEDEFVETMNKLVDESIDKWSTRDSFSDKYMYAAYIFGYAEQIKDDQLFNAFGKFLITIYSQSI
ncbi:MAG: hypothetical protein J6K48_01385 [Lachnospiraceae bacterium]|nr:hypothetical protein [Lachnospiraceae bacterium]